MKVLVLGCAGFLGSHLCARLQQGGHDVYGYDTFVTGSGKYCRHHHTLNPFNLRDRYDLVFHFASPASPVAYWQLPMATLEANSVLTLEAIRYCLREDARLVYASSSEVYGLAGVIPTPEEYWGHLNPQGPRSHYDEGKRFSEAAIATCARSLGLRARILRFFNVYGPRMRLDDGRAIPSFIGKALRGEPLEVHAPGTQTRCLTYVDDAVEGVLLAAFADPLPDEPATFNIGNPEEITVMAMASLVVSAAGSPSGITVVEGRQEEIARRVPDITRARGLLGWEPRVPAREGLERTVAWYREQGRSGAA